MEQPRGIQWTLVQKLEDLDFVDDVSLLSHTLGHMQAKTVLRDCAILPGQQV